VDVNDTLTGRMVMDQVEYNRRYAAYDAELKAIVCRFSAEREGGILADEDAEMERLERLEEREEAETDAARGRFLADVGPGPITRGF
jgi:hypothetical protein